MQSSCFLCRCCLHTLLVVLWFVLFFFARPPHLPHQLPPSLSAGLIFCTLHAALQVQTPEAAHQRPLTFTRFPEICSAHTVLCAGPSLARKNSCRMRRHSQASRDPCLCCAVLDFWVFDKLTLMVKMYNSKNALKKVAKERGGAENQKLQM